MALILLKNYPRSHRAPREKKLVGETENHNTIRRTGDDRDKGKTRADLTRGPPILQTSSDGKKRKRAPKAKVREVEGRELILQLDKCWCEKVVRPEERGSGRTPGAVLTYMVKSHAA